MKKLFAFHLASPTIGFSLDIFRFSADGRQCGVDGTPDEHPLFELSQDGQRIRQTHPSTAPWIVINELPEGMDGTDPNSYYVTDDPNKAFGLLEMLGGAIIKQSDPPPAP